MDKISLFIFKKSAHLFNRNLLHNRKKVVTELLLLKSNLTRYDRFPEILVMSYRHKWRLQHPLLGRNQ